MDLNEYKQLKTNELLMIEINKNLQKQDEISAQQIIDSYTLNLIENDLLK